MIVQKDIKLIYYSDAEPQMFNLSSDPEELQQWFDPRIYAKMMESMYRMNQLFYLDPTCHYE